MTKYFTILFLFFYQCAFNQIKINNLFFNSTSNIAKLNFSTNPPGISYTSIGSGDIIGEGIAHAEDEKGDIVIWVNSNGVYDKNNTLMPGSKGILANPSSTEIAICPFPGNRNKYYVFYNSQLCSTLYYSVVDLSQRNGLGDVIENNISVDNANAFAEGLEIVKHPCQNQYWLLAYQCYTGFKCFKIDGSGITLNNTFSYLSESNEGRGELDYHKGKMGYSMAFTNKAFLCDFDPVSGLISNSKTITVNSLNGLYGLEFSPNASKVYFTDWYARDFYGNETLKNLFRYDFNSSTIDSYKIDYNTTNCIDPKVKVEGLGQIELGKDGKLYIPHFNGCQITVIKNADDANPVFDIINVNTILSSGISDPIQSSIFQPFQFTADKNNICPGEIVKLEASGGSGYIWKSSDKIIINNTSELFVNPQRTTIYTLFADNQYGCKDSLQIELKVLSDTKPFISINFNTASACDRNNIILYTNKGLSGYQWTKEDALIENANTDSLLILEPGKYNVLIGGEKCITKVDSIIISPDLFNKKILYIPNVITPNNDGRNEEWRIINHKENSTPENYPGIIAVKIYNRWGIEVFSDSNYKHNWNAEGLSNGIYYYQISHNENCFLPQRGWINVMR